MPSCIPYLRLSLTDGRPATVSQSAASRLHFICSQIAQGRSLSVFGSTVWLNQNFLPACLALGSTTRYNSDNISDVFFLFFFLRAFSFTRVLELTPQSFSLRHLTGDGVRKNQHSWGGKEIENREERKEEITCWKWNIHYIR